MEYLSQTTKSKLMGLAMELAVNFFFKNFCYTFGGKKFIQLKGGPIGARLTMAVARIVMQAWKDKFDIILKNSNIEEILSGLYVDDGRSFHRKLNHGERYCKEMEKFVVVEEYRIKDIEA